MQRGIGSILSIAGLLGLAALVAAPHAAADDSEVRGVRVGLGIPDDITTLNRGTVERFVLNKTRSSIRLTTFWGFEQSRLTGHIELLIEKSMQRVPPNRGSARVEVLSAEFTAVDLSGGAIPEDRVELFLDEQEISAGIHDPIDGWIAFSLYMKIPDRDNGFPMPIEVFGWLVDGHLTLVGDNAVEDSRIEMEIEARRFIPSALARSEPSTDLPRDPDVLADGSALGERCDPCDTNCDGSVDLTDVEPFIELLLGSGEPCGDCAGDTNSDGSVDLTDIEGFIGCLLEWPVDLTAIMPAPSVGTLSIVLPALGALCCQV